jgi:UDP-glucose 4-epimerase
MLCALVAAGGARHRARQFFDWIRLSGRRGHPFGIGDNGHQNLVSTIIKEREVKVVIHFAASIVVPDSVPNPLGYPKINTVNSRALIECVDARRAEIHLSSAAAVYGNPAHIPVTEDDALMSMSPHGSSELMTETRRC